MRFGVVCMAAFAVCAARAAIEKVPLKTGWKFVRADEPGLEARLPMRTMSDILDRAERGDLSGAPTCAWAAPALDDASWQDVRVPHDWGVDRAYDPALSYGDAFLPVTGVGWYRLTLKPLAVPPGGKVFFECDGAMSYAMTWINGAFVGGWPYGYTRWRVDLTPHLKGDGTDRLAIRCHNVKDSSRWYTGGGLIRNCRLLVCPADYVLPGSVHITTPEVTAKAARVHVTYVMSKSGKKDYSFTVANPRLWDIDDPHLYTLDVEGNTYRYGIRTLSFNADERRFQLNGRTVPLNGVSMHHDFGVLGAAWNRAAQKRRLLAFREAGVNAIRSSHNPPEEELLELCDELGILVKDEVFDEWKHMGDAGKRKNGYHNIFETWHERDIRAWMRVDRNHPSVIMWSLGNEICDGKPKIAPHAEYVARARHLARIAASEDSTRPTTNANNNPENYTNDFPKVLGIMGCNYFAWQYPRLKEIYPDVPYFGTETICIVSTRGEYSFPVRPRWTDTSEITTLANSSYCWEGAGFKRLDSGWACPPDAQWWWMDQVKTCMGEFVWTGVDYLGGPYWADEWRRKLKTKEVIHTCSTGFLDQSGFRKDSFYLFQSRWRPGLPMAHILPHWNWPGCEGQVTPVYVFTSGDEGELFLNGKSLGRQKKDPAAWDRAYRLRWDDVVYAPGTLEVVTYRDGREWARDKVVTTGAPAKIALTAETKQINSDGEDLAFVTVSILDAEGRVVPTADTEVRFTVTGPAKLVATDNGSEFDMADFHAPERRAFHGLAQAILRADEGAAGVFELAAAAEGLAGAKVSVKITKGKRK